MFKGIILGILFAAVAGFASNANAAFATDEKGQRLSLDVFAEASMMYMQKRTGDNDHTMFAYGIGANLDMFDGILNVGYTAYSDNRGRFFGKLPFLFGYNIEMDHESTFNPKFGLSMYGGGHKNTYPFAARLNPTFRLLNNDLYLAFYVEIGFGWHKYERKGDPISYDVSTCYGTAKTGRYSIYSYPCIEQNGGPYTTVKITDTHTMVGLQIGYSF